MVRTRPTLAHFVMGSDPTTKPNPQSRRADSNRAELLLALLAALPHQPKVAARGLEVLFDARGERKLAETVRRWHVERSPSR